MEFEFTKPGEKGEEHVFETLKIKNAQILSLGPYIGSLPTGSRKEKRYESVTLQYQEAVVTGGPAVQAGLPKKFGEWA